MKCKGKGVLFPLENRKKSRTFFRTEKVFHFDEKEVETFYFI